MGRAAENAPSVFMERVFHILLIPMSGPQSDPKVRVLVLAHGGVQAVYDGEKSVSKCRRWLGQLPRLAISDDEKVTAWNAFVRNQFAFIHAARLSLDDLMPLGLERADG